MKYEFNEEQRAEIKLISDKMCAQKFRQKPYIKAFA